MREESLGAHEAGVSGLRLIKKPWRLGRLTSELQLLVRRMRDLNDTDLLIVSLALEELKHKVHLTRSAPHCYVQGPVFNTLRNADRSATGM